MENFEKTFWRYSPTSIFYKNKSKYIFFAVIKQHSTKLTSIAIEIMFNSIKHPLFGVIPIDNLKYYNLFDVGGNRFGKHIVSFYANDEDYQLLARNIDDLILFLRYFNK